MIINVQIIQISRKFISKVRTNSWTKYNCYLTMGKKTTEKGKKVITEERDNLFEIYGNGLTYYKGLTRISYQPQKIHEAREDQQTINTSSGEVKTNEVIRQVSIVPIFNHDNKYFTSSFVNPFENEDSDSTMLVYHEAKVKQTTQQVDLQNMFIPKPRHKNHYCAVCRKMYDDYLEHIDSSNHKKNIKKSMFNTEINILVKRIQEKDKKYEGVVTRSKKMLEMQRKRLLSQFELNSLPYRKRKEPSFGNRLESTDQPLDKETKKEQPLETTAKSQQPLIY